MSLNKLKTSQQCDFTSNMDCTCDDSTWQILKANFKEIEPVEKHFNISLSYIFSQAVEETYGKKNSEKYSKKKLERIKEKILNKLRTRYGKWITLSQLIWHRRSGKFQFITNFNCTYKTKKGHLYGHYKAGRLRQLFYTSHCLQRFEERINEERYTNFKKAFKKINEVYPNATDIIDFLVHYSFQYGISKDYRYLNIYFGVLVVEVLKDVYIVKTFLTPEMLDERKIDWYMVVANQYDKQNNNNVIQIDSMNDFFLHKAEKTEPLFFGNEDNFPEEFIEFLTAN